MGTGGYWRVLAGDVFGAPVVGPARDPYCEMCSGPMLWDVFGPHVVGCVRGTYMLQHMRIPLSIFQ